MADIAHHNIQIFQAPTYENEDEETLAEAEEIASKIPFAVVGSNQLVATPDGREVRGRAYPWGVVEVDNEDHCDFVKLRQMLVRTYMEELREYTNDVLYENWRTEKLLSMGVAQDSSVFKEINPAARLQEERILHEAKLAKMEAEMKMVFQQKVQEKEAKLKQSEEELYARHKEMKEALEKQRIELEDKKRRLETGRPLTPEKASVSFPGLLKCKLFTHSFLDQQKEGLPPYVMSVLYHALGVWHIITTISMLIALLHYICLSSVQHSLVYFPLLIPYLGSAANIPPHSFLSPG